MSQIEKAIIYIGSYFMLFIAASGLEVMKDLPQSYDVLVFLACVYIVWARDEILAFHVIGSHATADGNIFKKLVSSCLRIIVGMVIVKLMVLGFYQYVLILYLIDYLTWIQTGRALSHTICMFNIERNSDESKA